MLEHVVVGGGIVGLAVGCALSRFGATVVLERHRDLISETSSHNSGVVHAGIYYPPKSLKTQLCIRGNENTWRLVDKYGIRARKCGKYVGSITADEDAQLEKIAANMRELGRPFTMVSQKEMLQAEPLVRMRTVLHSSSTGIIDVCDLRDFFVSQIQGATTGSMVLTNTEVQSIQLHADKVRVLDSSGGTVDASYVVLCAGLNHASVWNSLSKLSSPDGPCEQVPQKPEHRLHFCRGSYVGYRKKVVRSLVYPCPLPNNKGMGVHSTIDLDGNVKFGPDAEYVADPYDLKISEARAEHIVANAYDAVRRYIPTIEKDHMFADFSGMRPKLSGEGEPARDFVIERSGDRIVSLVGIESPGLTASTAIADEVTNILYGDNPSKSPWAL